MPPQPRMYLNLPVSQYFASVALILRVARVAIVAVLCGLMLCVASCTPAELPNSIIKQAIVLQLEQTQATLNQELRLNPPQYQVQSVDVQSKKLFYLDNLVTYRLQGDYRLAMTFPHHRVVQDHNPFEIYIQEQAEGESWRLAIPVAAADEPRNEQRWQTYRVE